ncbi:MAG: TIGR02996 domain-containing protein [Planctomycetes bacterium]|nr:TIGR02996 domain-containing protein [Planctomycetota bacterium]
MSAPWTAASIEALAPDNKSLTAARELLRAGALSQVEPTADGRGWCAACHGTSDLYRVAVRSVEYGRFDYECDCPSYKSPCKHTLALLLHLADNPELQARAEPRERAAADFEGLLRAVFADPDDDTPRLVFADYLDENDQPHRAALIRVQCERARLPETDPRASELAEAEKELLDRVADAARLPKAFGAEFRRGFVRLRAGPGAFRPSGSQPARVADLFHAGWVESVWFHDTFQAVHADAHELLRRAGELDFSSTRQGDANLVRLAMELPAGAEGHRLARVRVHPKDEPLFRAYTTGTVAPTTATRPDWNDDWWLRAITPEQLERLLRAGRVEGVTELTFNRPTFGDRGAEVIAASDLALTELELNGAGVGPAGAAALAAAGWFPRLLTLAVTQCPLQDDGVAALARPSASCALRSLQLSGVGAGDAGVSALAASDRFPALETIDLERNEIAEIAAAELLGSEYFPALRRVELDGNPIRPERCVRLALEARDRPALDVSFGNPLVTRTATEPGNAYQVHIRGSDAAALAALAGSSALRRVAALALEESVLTTDAAGALASALAPDVWRSADLTGCTLAEKPAVVLERLISGHRLAALDLTRTGLRYPDVYRFTLCPALASVKVLDLSANPMGTGGLEAVLASPHLRGVERFVLKELNLSQRDRARFEKEFGGRAEF